VDETSARFDSDGSSDFGFLLSENRQGMPQSRQDQQSTERNLPTKNLTYASCNECSRKPGTP
jgi:hypothetical protein